MRYLTTFGAVGMLLPLLFCWTAPTAIAQPAISSTILILVQVVTEELSHGPSMHMLPTLLVPIGFNTYRMGPLMQWVQESWQLLNQHTSSLTLFGFALGVTNLIMWAYNLFVFLLLRITPQFWDTRTFPVAKVQWQWQLWPILK